MQDQVHQNPGSSPCCKCWPGVWGWGVCGVCVCAHHMPGGGCGNPTTIRSVCKAGTPRPPPMPGSVIGIRSWVVACITAWHRPSATVSSNGKGPGHVWVPSPMGHCSTKNNPPPLPTPTIFPQNTLGPLHPTLPITGASMQGVRATSTAAWARQ